MKLHLGLSSRLVGLCLCALGCASSAWAAAKPNIVVIMSDDAAYSNFGFSAALNNLSTQIETPNLDALAQQSIVASQAYVASPLCAPTRAGLLTGQYQQRYGFEENLANTFAAAGTQGLTAQQTTIAQRLKPLGYTTGIIGKWHQGFVSGLNRPLDKGFDEFYGMLGGGRNYFLQNTQEQGVWKNNQFYESQYRLEGDPSKYDPVNGRYFTDAVGEEAVDFINRHADDENPFFLYLPFTAPHEPFQAKQVDLDHFAHITNSNTRYIAAMTYAMDRSIGEVLGAIDANGVDDNTIVLFMNDNGAVSYIGNPPFRGHKGTTWEGGIRVPMLIKGSGLEPGVYDGPITMYDLLPTLVNAGGGDASAFATDGYDVMPYLTGEATDDPTKVRFWRSFDTFAVRQGDWKFTNRFTSATGANPVYLFNIETDPHEDVNAAAAHRDIEAELLSELTHWEATMEKPKWGAIGTLNQNVFDHFVFRNDQAATTIWSATDAWQQTGTTTNVTMTRGDAYANSVFEFAVRNDANYTATNDMTRLTRQTFMLNQFRLTGNFTGATSHQGTINGNAVLFVKSLTGQLPSVLLDATASGTPAGFTFEIQNELQLLDDFEIKGNGTQNFVISGSIRDFYVPTAPASVVPLITVPHNVRKTGSSHVTLTGNNTFGGKLSIDQGVVTVNGPSAAINGAEGIEISSVGSLTLQSGTIAVDWINKSAGGTFNFNGGLLKVIDFTGNLTNNGGTFSPGASPALSSVSGIFSQTSGTLLIELGGTTPGTAFDRVMVGGAASLGGTLDIDLVSGFVPTRGQTFQFLAAAGGVNGMFANTLFPALPGGLTWNLVYNSHVAALVIGPAGGLGSFLPGDYNQDGNVDAADYTVWRNALNTSSMIADGNADGAVTAADYQIWKSAYGLSSIGGGGASIVRAVPEPSGLLIWLGGTCLLWAAGTACRVRSRSSATRD